MWETTDSTETGNAGEKKSFWWKLLRNFKLQAIGKKRFFVPSVREWVWENEREGAERERKTNNLNIKEIEMRQRDAEKWEYR
jgi:hypothetical protein